MTVIIGILCSDGVVIGSDSAMAAGRAGAYTMEWQDAGVLKTETFQPDVVTAVTGAIGLGQRCNDQIDSIIRTLRQPFSLQQALATQGIGVPLPHLLIGKVADGAVPFNALPPVQIGTIISQMILADFQRTASPLQTNTALGWGLGALLAFSHADKPYLVEFDTARFHPEFKGMPDSQRANQNRNVPWGAMGAGQAMADAFLAHAYRLLRGNAEMKVGRAKLLVAWTIDHVKRYNQGLVGGKTHLALLERVDGAWQAHHEDAGEVLEQVEALDAYISDFRPLQQPPTAAADPSAIDTPLAQQETPTA